MGATSEKKIRPFVDWLEEHKKGEVDTELTHHLRELVEAVQDTGKAGDLTLTLKVKPRGERQVTIIEGIKVKTPEHDRSESIYFVDQHRNLLRNDPRQGVLAPFKRDAAAGSDGDA